MVAAGVTVVAVAHWLSSIKIADTIVVVQKGEIVEKGTYESLLKEFPEGVFAEMVALIK